MFGAMVGSTTRPINETIISEVNLPEERALILGYLIIFELLGKSLGVTFTGFISTITGYLLYGLIGSLSFYYLGGLIWFLVAKEYGKDRDRIEMELEEYIRRAKESS